VSSLAIALAAAVVFGMASGQVLFKIASGQGDMSRVLLSPVLWGAAVLYGVVTILWVMLLREVDLARAYPLMALTYVLVPAASVLLLGEKVGSSYLVGVALIVAGIILTIRS
jgi:drug/metabolite transporter (DMT)-like permease